MFDGAGEDGAAQAPTDWTEARQNKLRARWNQTEPVLSAAQIGREFNLSKNAIIGKARRMGLAKRKIPIVARQEAAGLAAKPVVKRPARAAPDPNAWATPVHPLAPPRPAERRDSEPPAPPAPKPPVQPLRTSEQCRWVHGDVRERNWRYCDAPCSALGGSWCDEHRGVVFIKIGEVGP